MLESEADRLAMIKAVGEQFTTGHPDPLWMIFDREYVESVVGDRVVANRQPVGECRESDVELHGLIKNSVLTRVSDGSVYRIKDLEPDGVGMVRLILRS